MKRIRHSPEQIIRRLREADAVGGIKADEMKRLKELEKENARLKALVADLALDKAVIRSDNGPEFIAEAVRAWLAGRGAKALSIAPGSPLS